MFTKDYWKSSASKLKDIRWLAVMASFIALETVLKLFYIPVGENLRIQIVFLAAALEAWLVGPVAAVVSAIASDLIGFMLFPSGPFFAGYTLSEAAAAFFYAIWMYRHKASLVRMAGSRICVNYLVNVLMGSLWSSILYSKGFYYYMMKSLVKNSILLPFEILAMLALFKVLEPFLLRRKLIVYDEEKADTSSISAE